MPSRRLLLCLCLVSAVAGFGFLSPGCGSSLLSRLPGMGDRSEYQTLSSRPDRMIVQLDNGLVVIAQEIPTAPVASVHCYVKTGSIYEGKYNGKGLSHFLEHLASGGSTTTRTEEQSNAILGRIGAQTNASTSLDTVRYYINTSSEHAAGAIDLISDWMQNSRIENKEFEREQQVIRREFDMGRGEPNRIFWKLTQQARYHSHPARHPTIGYLDEFNAVTRDELYDFYRTMYVPNNMVFVVAGDIDKKAVVDQVAQLWKDSPAGEVPTFHFPREKPIDSVREMTGQADIDRPRLRLAWEGTRLAAEHDFALDLLAQVLGQGELSRLVQKVRNDQRLVTSIEAYNASFTWGEGFFGVDAVPAKGKLEEARAAILKEVRRIRSGDITEEELQRARRKTIASVVYSSQTAHATAGRLGSDFLHMGDPDYLQRYAQAIEKISRAEVEAAADKFLDPQRMIVVRLQPHKGDVDFQKRTADKPVDPTAGHEVVSIDNAHLVQKFRGLGRSGAEVGSAQLGKIRSHVLPNGLRVVLQRNTQLPIVAMQWYHLGGLMADDVGREGVANAAANMMIKGAGDLGADEISRRLEQIGAELSTACGSSTFYTSAQCLSGDWQSVLELVSAVIQEPKFDPAQWQLMKPRILAAIDSQNDVWYSQLRNGFRQAYFGEHPWAQPVLGRRKTIEGLTAADLGKFHRTRIAAADGVLAIFGDIDEAEVLKQVEKLFSGMPRRAQVPFVARKHAAIDSRVEIIESSKPLVAVQIGYGPGLARKNVDYPAMLVMNRVLSSFPVGWLDQALRGKGPGLVYAVGAGTFTGVAPGYWSLLFNTQPKTAREAMARALEVVDRVRRDQVDADTIGRARTSVLVSEALSRQSNGQRATNAVLDELYGVGFDSADGFIDQIRSVTAADVQRVAGKYLAEPVAVILTNQKLKPSDLPALTPSAEGAGQK
ncbi:MAG: insulinase family protein [Phycisphaerae bacterium]|nr:insulinase family protein [Phycisphaerae bacterium]